MPWLCQCSQRRMRLDTADESVSSEDDGSDELRIRHTMERRTSRSGFNAMLGELLLFAGKWEHDKSRATPQNTKNQDLILRELGVGGVVRTVINRTHRTVVIKIACGPDHTCAVGDDSPRPKLTTPGATTPRRGLSARMSRGASFAGLSQATYSHAQKLVAILLRVSIWKTLA